MPLEKQVLTSIKLQSRFHPSTISKASYIVPSLYMSGHWLKKFGLDIGSRVEIQEHPDGLLIKKIEE